MPNGNRESCFYAYVLNKGIYKGKLEGWQTREGLGLPLAGPIEIDYPAINETFVRKRKK